MEKLSVIIPAYNAADYIERCLDSILDQEFKNALEIIVVNDGSTDSTGVILDKYYKQYPDIFKIITKENGGQASARNVGLENATGDWVWFCDADDYIAKNGMSYVIDNFVDDEIDICSFWMITLDAIALKTFKEPEKVEGKCFFDGTTLERYEQQYGVFLVNHLYRREVVKDVRFRDVKVCEDVFFNFDVYMKDVRIRCTDVNIYRYTTHVGQYSKKRDIQTMQEGVNSYLCLFNRAKEYESINDDERIKNGNKRLFAFQASPFISRLLSLGLSKHDFTAIINDLKDKGIYPIQVFYRTHPISNFIIRNTWLYPVLGRFYRGVFVPYILPKLSRN